MKKIWQKPKLIVLYRARSEESVLKVCKRGGDLATGPQTVVNACAKPNCSGACVDTTVT